MIKIGTNLFESDLMETLCQLATTFWFAKCKLVETTGVPGKHLSRNDVEELFDPT